MQCATAVEGWQLHLYHFEDSYYIWHALRVILTHCFSRIGICSKFTRFFT